MQEPCTCYECGNPDSYYDTEADVFVCTPCLWAEAVRLVEEAA